MVNNPPAVWETLVQSLGWEDPLQEEMATYSGILAWEIPQIEEPGRLQSMGLQIVGYKTEQIRTHSNVSAVQYHLQFHGSPYEMSRYLA